MSRKSRMDYPGREPSNDDIMRRLDFYMSRGLTQFEATDLVQIERIENADDPDVPISDSEKARKKEYLDKINKFMNQKYGKS